MKSFFSRITMATVFGLLAGIGLSYLSFNPEALAQFPNPVKEAKKRAEEEKKRLKEEEEKRLRELKEAEDKAREEEKRLKEEANKLREEEKRLKEEEANKLREEKRLKEEEEKRLREEEKRLKEEEDARLKEEEKRLKEEENRLKEEKSRLKEEKRFEEEETRLKEKEEGDRLREERERRKKEAKNGNSAPGAPVRADGLDVAILMMDSRGTFSPVDPSREFVNGDQFRVEYNSRLNGIVYLVNVDPKGVATVIYRDEVSYGKKYTHPAPEENQVIQFRGSAGIEVLKIIISPKEIPDLENALRESDGKMGTNMPAGPGRVAGICRAEAGAGQVL